MRHDFGDLAFPCVHPIEEVMAPQIFRRHVDQLFDVDRGHYGLPGAIRTAIGAFDAIVTGRIDDPELAVEVLTAELAGLSAKRPTTG